MKPKMLVGVAALSAALLPVIFLFSGPVKGDPAAGQLIFEQKCAGCHTIGMGKTVGPDLKGVSERRERRWIITFIIDPAGLLARDPVAMQLLQEYGIPMPGMGVSEAQAEDILDYIDSRSEGPVPSAPGAEQTVPSSPPESPPATLPAADAGEGRAFFTGENTFKNGGAACISCHSVNGIGTLGGGTVGRDLTGIYTVAGDQGIAAMLKTTPFPIMKGIYGTQPLTDEEIAGIIAFLKETSARPAGTPNGNMFVILSLAGLVVLAGIFQLLWRRRLSGVRRPLVKGGPR